MNPYADMANQMQGDLNNFMTNLQKSHRSRTSSKSRSRMRGGDKGEIIPEGYRKGKLNVFDKKQNKLYESLFPYLKKNSYLAQLARGEEGIFNEMEAPAMRQFNELQGALGSRFSGMGMGARNSSGFQNTANQAASNFAQDLQAKRQELMRQARGDLFEMSNMLLSQRPTESLLTQKYQPPQEPYEPSTGEQLLGAAGSFFGGFGETAGKAAGKAIFG